MAQPVYATVDELANAIKPKTPPANAEQLLVDASGDIDDLILSAVYETDAAGYPTDPEIRDALKQATIALIRWWGGIGEDGTGITQVLTSASIAGVALGFGNGGKDQPSMKYGPRVPGILARAGLMARAPYIAG